jgi:hypothetical protein
VSADFRVATTQTRTDYQHYQQKTAPDEETALAQPSTATELPKTFREGPFCPIPLRFHGGSDPVDSDPESSEDARNSFVAE